MARSDKNKPSNEQNESLDDILNDENFIFSSFRKMDFKDVQAELSRQPRPRDDVAVAQRQSSPRREEPIASTGTIIKTEPEQRRIQQMPRPLLEKIKTFEKD
ncbi:hypothetical protein PUN28_006144 [Cardiocondyla obscurior]|uniref:Uncharacterized protein n=1 Tax=Cardiocondyla obscurior TaxID=286306 RepID=A0AAW2G9V5_9HYME